MVRKRKTQAQSSRAKPKLKEDEDELVNGMTAAEKEAKLTNYIKDFDVQVANITSKYEHEQKVIESLIDKIYQQIRIKLSMRERKLTIDDYIAEQIIEEQENENGFESPTETIVAVSHPAPLATLNSYKDTLSKYRSKRVIEPILEEGGVQTTVQKSRKRVVANKGHGVTFNADPTPISTLHSRFITPAMQRNASAMGWETPLVTPKFDPRLPITPAQKRQARPGEIAMSMAGSPLALDGESSKPGRSLAIKGRTTQIQLPDSLEVPDDIENWSGNHLKQVINVFTNLMKTGQEIMDEPDT